MIEIANNGTTRVVRDGNRIIKYMPKTFCDNECHALERMHEAAKVLWQEPYVPRFRRLGVEEVEIEFIHSTPITDKGLFMAHLEDLQRHMRVAGVRHGDLTTKSIIPCNNRPMIIDWSESRHHTDTRPDKRPEGDEYWLLRSMRELCNAS